MLFDSDFEILQEKYVGDNFKEFRVMEDCLAKMIKKYKKAFAPAKKFSDVFKVVDQVYTLKDENHKLFEKTMCKFFGLKSFNLLLVNDPQPNAGTITQPFSMLRKNKDGQNMYKDNIDVFVKMDVKFFTYFQFNEREILAIIIHEVGHNFYNSPIQLLSHIPISLTELVSDKGVFNLTNSVLGAFIAEGLLKLINFPKTFGMFNEAVKKLLLMKPLKPLRIAIDTFSVFMFNFTPLSGLSITPLMVLNLVDYFMKNPAEFFSRVTAKSIFGYNDERFADSFAVDHGYGKDLASAIRKLENCNNAIGAKFLKETPGINWIHDLTFLQLKIISAVTDEHPLGDLRVHQSLERLKDHMNDPDLDPKIRQQLKKEVAEFEKFYDTYTSKDFDDNKKKVCSFLFKTIILKVFKGHVEPREILWKLDPKSKLDN